MMGFDLIGKEIQDYAKNPLILIGGGAIELCQIQT